MPSFSFWEGGKKESGKTRKNKEERITNKMDGLGLSESKGIWMLIF